MKRLLALALVFILICFPLLGCSNQGKIETTLLVGCFTEDNLEGNFLPGVGRSSGDGWIKTILYEFYSTYVVNDVGEFVLNKTVVKEQDISWDSAGNKTYTFEIYPDLRWNNGEAILAQDYVFAMLWLASREWADAGATSSVGTGLLGYSDYHEGTASRFAGVRLLDDYKFSLTIAAENTPYFFEASYLSIYPLPLASWAPAVEIDSGPGGAKLVSHQPNWTLADDTRRIFQTQRSLPTVTSGPFSIESYADIEEFGDTAVFLKANPYFKGDYLGRKPQVDCIDIRVYSSDIGYEACIAGEVDAMPHISQSYAIEGVLNEPSVETSYYSRNGFGGMFFHCDYGPVQYQEVRQALACLLDRQELIRYYDDGHASVVNGLYGLGQWMYMENKAAIDSLPEFKLDIAKANELLDQSPYRFEADGKTPFDAALATEDGGYYRHNAQGERLVINHVDGMSGSIIEPIPSQLLYNAPLVGIDWRAHEQDFNSILNHYLEGWLLPEEERLYHSFPLTIDFTAAFDPYPQFHSQGQQNYVRISDEELDKIIERMRRLDPQQKEEFSAEWVRFQTRWNQVLPMLPILAAHYYDIYRKEVKGFYSTPFTSWAANICGVSIEE